MTIYKYQIFFYNFYQKFKETVFVSKEIEESGLLGLHLSTCRRKKYISTISREEAEEVRPEIKEWYDAPWRFQKISNKGHELCRFLKDNPNLIAKKMLTDSIKGKNVLMIL